MRRRYQDNGCVVTPVFSNARRDERSVQSVSIVVDGIRSAIVLRGSKMRSNTIAAPRRGSRAIPFRLKVSQV